MHRNCTTGRSTRKGQRSLALVRGITLATASSLPNKLLNMPLNPCFPCPFTTRVTLVTPSLRECYTSITMPHSDSCYRLLRTLDNRAFGEGP